jgi:hypothetical protein
MDTSRIDYSVPRGKTRFTQALEIVREWVIKHRANLPDATIVLRDLRGRFRLILPEESQPVSPQLYAACHALHAELGAYSPGEKSLLVTDHEFIDAASLVKSADLRPLFPDQPDNLKLLDREPQNGDWLRPAELIPGVNAVTFFGLKGGVGRSTALILVALRLAQQGRKVLAVDLDLESPGLTSILLPQDRLPPSGLIDWFVESAVGQADTDLAKAMLAPSPLAQDTSGAVLVAPAFGRGESDYLAKLARAYLDQPGPERPKDFALLLREGLTALATESGADVLLLDSRAGLHDIAASAVVRLGAQALLFATDAAQTWRAYRLLFDHWKSFPSLLPGFRDKLKMVDALIPETERAAHAESFLQNAYQLFSETIYETAGPGETPEFNFDLADPDAPHSPLPIRWSRIFQGFDPLTNETQIEAAEVEAAYGNFLNGVLGLLAETSETSQ